MARLMAMQVLKIKAHYSDKQLPFLSGTENKDFRI